MVRISKWRVGWRGMHFAAILCLASLLGTTANADHDLSKDFIEVPGKLSNEDFYRLVACAATPGGKCHFKPMKWPKSKRMNITVGVVHAPASLPGRFRRTADRALDQAIEQINGVGAGLRLTRVRGVRPDVSVRLVDVDDDSLLPQSNDWRGTLQTVLVAAFVDIDADRSGRINGAAISMRSDVYVPSIRSIMLEELIQGMGLPMDVRSPYYKRRSIFSQDDSRVKKLVGQDAAIIRMHYPK